MSGNRPLETRATQIGSSRDAQNGRAVTKGASNGVNGFHLGKTKLSRFILFGPIDERQH